MEKAVIFIIVLSFSLSLLSMYFGVKIALWLLKEDAPPEKRRFSTSRHISQEAYSEAFEKGKYKPTIITEHDEWQAEQDRGRV